MDQADVKVEYTIPVKRQASTSSKKGINGQKNNSTGNARVNDGAGSVPEFIQKLFRMLENKAFKQTFCWGPDGTTFVVKDTNEFAKTILPKHFKHCNFASFVRQLNKYDFHKVRNAEDGHKPYGDQAWEFVHPKFRRDRKDLLEEIRRKTPGKQKKDEAAAAAATGGGGSGNNGGSGASGTKDKNSGPDGLNASKEDEDQLSSESLNEIRQLTESLQSQVSQLQQSQATMESTVQRLTSNDHLILNEFMNFSKNMAAKDELIRQFLQIAVNRDKERAHAQPSLHNNAADSNITSAETQKLLDSYSKVSNANTVQLENITKQLQHVPGEPWSQASSMREPTVPSQRASANPFNLSRQAEHPAVAAAASMNAGSLIGSPLKTGEGLAFVRLGRLSPHMSVKDNKPSLEIRVAPEESTSSCSAAETSQSMATPVPSSQEPVTIHNRLSMKRKAGGNGWTVPPRVLLVDDDSVYRDLSGKLLQVIGCTIDLAKDGMEAIRMMGMEKYDLILMDIVMPNLDGISATRNIRQYDMLTPIISMTSNFTDNDIVQYVGSGMNDILPKPFSKRTLYGILEKYCAHLKVIQQFQDPTTIHRGLGLLPPSTQDGSSGSSSSCNSPNSSANGITTGAFIEEITPQPTAVSSTASVPQVPTQQQIPSSSSSPSPSSHPVATTGISAAPMPYSAAMNPTVPGMHPNSLNPSYQHHHPLATPLVPTNSVSMNAAATTTTVWSQQQPSSTQPPMSAVPAQAQTMIPSNDVKFTWIPPNSSSETQAPQIEFAVAGNNAAKRRRVNEAQ
ncbi:hypothetical protein BDB00DRAFT_984418 [Zychaea mexicana]|uniref:uncharacterized protein n=1 Tax=Zychaea mexicana TaxID=64656 RepID=UPI0022FE6E33|nr:uncharacterized protein BDB00DRAFT_984418 [Zychaea mexicana]KAI9482548.1 hypothetical protein BDB00DRAFT_984418 [Zychaea mexicana]